MICIEVFRVLCQLPIHFIFGVDLVNYFEKSVEDSDRLLLLSTKCELALTNFRWASIKQIMEKNVFVIWVRLNHKLSYLSPT